MKSGIRTFFTVAASTGAEHRDRPTPLLDADFLPLAQPGFKLSEVVPQIAQGRRLHSEKLSPHPEP